VEKQSLYFKLNGSPALRYKSSLHCGLFTQSGLESKVKLKNNDVTNSENKCRFSDMEKFDWHCNPLSDECVITKNCKNRQNLGRHFKARFGDNFKMNVTFMAWLKTNTGKTLLDAVQEFRNNHQKLEG